MSNTKLENKIELVEEILLGTIEETLLKQVSGGAEWCTYGCSLLKGEEKCSINLERPKQPF